MQAGPRDYVGARVRVLFDNGVRYPARVKDYDAKRMLHRVDYDDGIIEWPVNPPPLN